MRFKFWVIGVALSLISCVTGGKVGKVEESSNVPKKVPASAQRAVSCSWSKVRFGAGPAVELGLKPGTISYPDLIDPKATHLNPLPKDADRFLRAASALQVISASQEEPLKIIVAQDSRRHLGIATFKESLDQLLKGKKGWARPLDVPKISSVKAIPEDDDDKIDYQSGRKKTKPDFEAMTTLPNGDILVLASGSDARSSLASKPSHRNRAVIYAAKQGSKVYDLLPFYQELLKDPDIVGQKAEMGEPEVNIEGAAIRPSPEGPVLMLGHRGNMNGNGHNTLIEYPLNDWLLALKGEASFQTLKKPRITKLEFTKVKTIGDSSGREVPITTGDLLYWEDQKGRALLIPLSTEAEYIDQHGQHVDGIVTFSGIAVWRNFDQADGGQCVIHQAPSDDEAGRPTRFGKIEGLAVYNPAGKDAFARSLGQPGALSFLVMDVDSETKPALLRLVDLSPILDASVP